MSPGDKITLALVAESGDWFAPPECRLRRLLKALHRAYGWRCVGNYADTKVFPWYAATPWKNPDEKE